MSKKAKKWYKRIHDFAPYTRADGRAVSDEFDAIQASFEKIPAMRDDGLGFAQSPIIPDPTEDNHPVPFHLLKNAEKSVYHARDTVIELAQQVSDNNNTTEQNTRLAIQASEQASQNQQLTSQSAKQAIEANKEVQLAKIATQNNAQIASTAKESATHASNLAQKWASNPVDEQVLDGKFSAYHYAIQAEKFAKKTHSNVAGHKDWSEIDNVPISSEVNDSAKDKIASAFAVKTAFDKATEAENLAKTKQAPADTLAGYGINNFKIEQKQTAELNELKTDGIYYIKSGQNLPDNGEWHVEILSGGNVNAVRQIARKAGEAKIKTRFFNGSKWTEWKNASGDGVPVGAVVAFAKEVNPQGFLLADGSTFEAQTYPTLYRTLGNKNTLPNLKRSDVGQLAYFAVDSIPDGWLAYDEIRQTVTEQTYPELYAQLIKKYGQIDKVPRAADRFIRNAYGSLKVGGVQEDLIKSHEHGLPVSSNPSNNDGTLFDYKNAQYLRTPHSELEIGLGDGRDNAIVHPKHKAFFTGGAENRPKSIIFKLCIKAKNTFDEVRFWIKAFGEVVNIGELDAGRLAQDLQKVRSETQELRTDLDDQIDGLTEQLVDALEYSYQKIDNYKIRKFPDGTLILSGKITNPAAGGRPDVTKLTFPVSFADDDYEMFATELRENGDTATYNLAFVQPVDKSSANICTWYGGSTFWQAIGRWK